jgi:hypothetical protein
MTADTFNTQHPVGTWVRYFPVKGDRKNYRDSRTRSKAYHLSTGTVVVPLARGGTVPLANIEILPTQQAVG